MKTLIPAFFAVGAVMSLAGAVMGAVMSLAGAVSYITKWPLAPYIFMVGSLLVAVAQIFTKSAYDSVNIRRLRRQQVLGALLLVATGPLMIFMHGNEWIVTLTLAAVIELFTSIRLPQEEEKMKKQ